MIDARVFAKEGSIIPVGPELQYTSEISDRHDHFVYLYGNNASSNLYEDEEALITIMKKECLEL